MAPMAEPAGKVRHLKVDLTQRIALGATKAEPREYEARRAEAQQNEGGPQTARRRPGRSAKRDVGRSGAAGVANGARVVSE